MLPYINMKLKIEDLESFRVFSVHVACINKKKMK